MAESAAPQAPSRVALFGPIADLEKKAHHAFQQMADQLVAGLLAQATKGADFADNAKKK